MKSKIIIAFLLVSATFYSCKKDIEVKQTDKSEAPTVSAKENFSIEMDVIAEKSDDLALYFTEDGTTNFNPNQVKWGAIKGMPDKQTFVLDLSEEIIPNSIRIDFGIKKGADQGDVTLQKLKMSYYGKSFETKGSDFLKYFVKNDSVQTEIDETNGTITFKKNPKSKFERFYYPQQTILDELKKITN